MSLLIYILFHIFRNNPRTDRFAEINYTKTCHSHKHLFAWGLSCKLDQTFSSLGKMYMPVSLQLLEQTTRQQSNYPVRQKHRAGRITASLFHKSCKFSGNSSCSESFVKSVMKYEDTQPHVPAVKRGIDNESKAKVSSSNLLKSQHTNFAVTLLGRVVRSDYAHFGASPDGIINCDCWGKGVLEIKCPYKYRDGLQNSHFDVQIGRPSTSTSQCRRTVFNSSSSLRVTHLRRLFHGVIRRRQRGHAFLLHPSREAAVCPFGWHPPSIMCCIGGHKRARETWECHTVAGGRRGFFGLCFAS